MSADDELALYTVYNNPKDYPGCFVARRSVVLRSGLLRVDRIPHAVCSTLEEVRAALPPGLDRLERAPNDDPVIVEVWM